MGSMIPRKDGVYFPQELAILGAAFEAVWETMRAQVPGSNKADEGILKALISERLIDIASVIGATDAQELRSAALESFSLRPDQWPRRGCI